MNHVCNHSSQLTNQMFTRTIVLRSLIAGLTTYRVEKKKASKMGKISAN